MATGSVPKSVRATLYIDGKPAVGSIKEVEQVTRSLERELKGLTIGTNEWNAKMKEVGTNKKYLAELRAEANGLGGAFNKIKAELGALGTLAAGYLGFQFISSQFQNIISGNAKLSDSLADVRRVTGLTEQGVLNLDASLGKLDTRTSKGGLREIAVIAGKLGVAKGDILGFVAATDKLVVALGDELGNADEVTTQLGKILNVFEGKVTGDNISKLGNAMVKLANDGVASAGFISNFTQQISGVAKAANLSLPATLAFGAGLEELGGRAESSATAIQKLLLSIAKDVPAAAGVAKMPIQEFTQLFAEKPEQALLKYTAGLIKNKAAFSDISASLTAAGEDGARVVTAITSLGQKTEFFTKKIDDASVAIQGYNELNTAFALKSETLGGTLDKISKQFNKLAVSSALSNFLNAISTGFAKIIGVNFPSELDRLTTAFYEQDKRVKSLETSLNPLVNRYDELKKKGKLNRDEQIEIKKVMNSIADFIPSAITQWDKYGNAIGVNTAKAKEFVLMQKEMMKVQNKDAIDLAEKQLKRLELYRYDLAVQQNRTAKTGLIRKSSGATYASNADIAEVRSLIKIAVNDIEAKKALLKGLRGDYLDEVSKPPLKKPAPKDDIVNTITDKEKKDLQDAEEKRIKRLADVQKILNDALRDMDISKMDDLDQVVAKITDKYDVLLKEFKDNPDLVAKLKVVRDLEVDNKTKPVIVASKEKNKKDLEKEKADEFSAAKTLSDSFYAEEKNKLGEQYANGLINKKQYDDKVKSLEQDKVKSLIAIYKQYGKGVFDLEKTLTDFKITEKDRELEKAKQVEQQKTEFAIEMGKLASDTVFGIIRQNQQTESDAKINSLNNQRDQELNNRELTEGQKKRINDKYDAQVAAEKTKAWKNEQKAAAAQAVINGALAITNIFATTPKVDFGVSTYLLLAASAASTLASLGTIASAKPPKFAVGGFNNENPAGFTNGATLFNNSASGRPFVAGEAGKEWIAPNWMLTDPRFAGVIGNLEVARKEKRSFAMGGFNGGSGSNTNTSQSVNFDMSGVILAIKSLEEKVKNQKVVNSLRTFHEDYNNGYLKTIENATA